MKSIILKNNNTMKKDLTLLYKTIFISFFFLNSFNLSAQVGCMNVVGNYTNTGTLEIDIVDPTSCASASGYDQLIVSGTATLSGTLEVDTFGTGFDYPTTSAGNTYTILTAGSVINTFGVVNFPTIASPSNASVNLLWTISYTATSVVVKVVDPCDDDVTPPLVFCPANVTITTNPATACSRTYTLPNFAINATGNPATMRDLCTTPYIFDISINGIGGYTPGNEVLQLGVNTIVYTIKDAAGNTSTCSYDVTVADDDLPTISCPYSPTFVLNVNSDAGVDNVPGDCGATVVWNQPTPDDNCGIFSVVELPSTPPGATYNTLINVGTYVITYRVTDNSANSNTCSFTLNVIDNQPPTFSLIQPPFLTTSSTVSCPSAAATPPSIIPSVQDNCPLAPPTIVVSTIPTCEGTVTHTYTWGTTPYTLTWVYTYTIERLPFNDAVDSFSTVACIADTVSKTPPVILDNCGNVITPVRGANTGTYTGCEGTIIQNWLYTDCEGNTNNWTYTYTIERLPFIDPTDGSSTVACIADTISQTPPSVTDNCGNAFTPVRSANTGTYSGCEGTIIQNWSYTDCEGNTNNWKYTYTIERLPFVDPTDGGTIVACIADTISQIPPTVTDNCGNSITPVRNPNTGTYSGCEGTLIQNWLYTDCEGNTNNWSYTYTIDITTPPAVPVDGGSTIACLAQATSRVSGILSGLQEVPPNGSPANGIVNGTFNPVSNTLAIEVMFNGLIAPATAAHIHFAPIGVNGPVIFPLAGFPATTFGTYTNTFSLSPPMVASLLAGNLYVNIHNAVFPGGEIRAQLAASLGEPTPPILADNCGRPLMAPTGVPTVDPTCEGTKTWAFTYTDCSGLASTWNYIYTIERLPFTDPTNGSSTVACIADTISQTPPSVTDNCGNALTPVRNPNTGTYAGCEGTVIQNWLYTDCAGNTNNWTYTYTIDRLPFVDPTDGSSTVACIADTISQVPPSVTDNCGNTLTPVRSGNTGTYAGCEGTIIQNWLYTDCAGNTNNWTYTYTIDRLPFNDPTDGSSTVACIADTISQTPPSLTDNCGNALTPVRSGNTGTYIGCEGTIIQNWLYTDCAGNTNNWTYTYTIDRLPFNDPTDGSSTVACISDTINQIPPSVTDNCGNTLTPVRNPNTGTYDGCEGTIIQNWLYTDCAGNTNNWTYTYTIDRLPFVDPTDGSSTVACIADTISQVPPSVTDNCGNDLTPVRSANTGTYTGCVGTIIQNWLYTDCAGNTNNWTYTYTIDRLPFVDPTDGSSIVECIADTISQIPPSVTDNCGNTLTPIRLANTGTYPNPMCEGTIIQNWLYTDCEGNTNDWKYTYTIDDITPPIAVCPPANITITIPNTSSYTITQLDVDGYGALSTDNCNGTLTFSMPDLLFDCDDTNTGVTANNIQTRVLTVTDCSELSSTCDVTFEVLPLDPLAQDDSEDICSDIEFTISLQDLIDNGVDPATFAWTVAYAPGLTNTSYVGPQTSSTITETGGITNTTSGPLNAVYTIVPTNPSSGCTGPTFTITKVIWPEPQVTSQAFTSTTNVNRLQVCSDVAINITLPNDDNGAPTVVSYNITNIDSMTLTSSAGSPTVGTGFTNTELLDDAWTNTSNANVNVVYTVVPVTADGCEGTPFTITVTIRPEPVVNNIEDEMCSDVALGFDVTLPNPADNGVGISAWTFTSLTNVGMIPSAGGQSVTGTWPYTLTNNIVNRLSLTGDQFTNVSSFDQIAIYSIVPVGLNPTGPLGVCLGDTFNVSDTIHPEPKPISPISGLQQCSGVTFSINLNDYIENILNPLPDSLYPVSYTWEVDAQIPLPLVVVYDENGSQVTTGNTYSVTDSILTLYGDNFATMPITLNLLITPTSKYGCVGNSFIIPAKINNNPSVILNTNGDNSLCEGEMRTLLGNAIPAGAPAIPYIYEWTIVGPSNGSTLTPVGTSNVKLTAGTADVEVQLKATNPFTGCKDSTSVIIDVLPLPTFEPSEPSNLEACATVLNGTSGVFVLGDAAPLTLEETYHLTASDALNNIGALNSTSNYSGSNGQVIWVRLTNVDGCVTTASFTLNVNNLPTVNITGDLAICLGEETELIPTLGFTSYFWIPIENGNDSIQVSPTETTTYEVLVTDANGCENTASATVVVNPLPTPEISSPDTSLCPGQSTTLTVDGGIDYLWSNGATTASISVSTAGTYSVEVSDANGCTAIASQDVIVSDPIVIDVETVNVSCFGGNDGEVSATATGGSGLITYSWEDGYANALTSLSGLSAGSYHVTATDQNGCTSTASVIITEPTAIEVLTPIVGNVKCFGGNDGSFNALITGGTPFVDGYDISIDGGAPIRDFGTAYSTLSANTYELTVTDSFGCTQVSYFEVTQPTELLISALSVDASCNGGNGTITASATGGNANYQFYIDYPTPNSPPNSPNFTSAAGIYTVVVSDANDCTVSTEVTIGEPAELTIELIVINENCAGSNDGTATTLVTGGTPGYTYAWSNGQSTSIATGLGNATYIVNVTDNNGCIISDTIGVGTSGPTPPMVINCPTNLNLFVQDCDLSYSWLAPTIVNNCVTTSLMVDLDGAEDEGLASGIQQANFEPGFYTIKYYDLTADPDTVACMFTVSVLDTIDPIVLCPPSLQYVCIEDTVEHYTDYLDFIADGGVLNDNCTELFSSFKWVSDTGLSSPACKNRDTISRLYKMADLYGNSGSCIQLLIIHDTVAPSFTNVALDVTVDCNNTLSIANPPLATANDNCDSGGATVTYNDVDDQNLDPLTCGFYNYTITRTWTATDDCGNSRDSVQIITVQDTIDPMAICQNINVTLDGNGEATITASELNNESTDICMQSSLLNLSASLTEFTCNEVGPNNITLTVTDACGNSSTCLSVVTVVDPVPPIANCNENLIVELGANGLATIDTTLINDASYDNCEVDTMYLNDYNFTCSDVALSPITITLTVVDLYGNSSTCTTDVTVEDKTLPLPVCSDTTVYLNILGLASVTPAELDGGSTDACNGLTFAASQTSFDCDDDATAVAVTLTVTDVNGNSSFCIANVTVIDTIDPVAICSDTTLYLDPLGMASVTPAELDGGSTDACNGLTFAASRFIFNCGDDTASVAVTLTVTDANGNSSICMANVTVVDTIDPIAICSDTTVYLNVAGIASVTAEELNGGSSDACGGLTYSASSTSFDCDDDVTPVAVTLTVTDANGNTSICIANVTVVDTIDPIAICLDTTLYLNAFGMAEVTPAELDGGSSDACNGLTFAASQTSFYCSDDAEPVLVTLTVTDANGNTSICVANITVVDTIDPAAICQDIIVELNSSGVGTTTASAVDNGSEDACGLANLALSQTIFGCSEVGPNTEILTVTDVNGNTSTCTSTITVEDFIAPIAVCQDITIQLNVIGQDTIAAADINDGSTDACGIDTITLDITTFNCSNVGGNTVELTVTDVNGNSTTCTATVDVEDNVSPIAICQNVMVSLNNLGEGSTTPAAVDNGSNDPCGIESLELNIFEFDCSDVGTNPVILTVTDNNGNITQCNATVMVVDEVDPIAFCQNITIQLNSLGQDTITAANINSGSNDACSLDTMYLDNYNFTCLNVGSVNAVMLTVTDVNGNSATCSATVLVEDLVAPTAICKNDTIYLNNLGLATTSAAAINNESNDACGILTMNLDVTNFDCADISTNPNPVVLTVTDINGNSSTCSATVTVVDNLTPTFSQCFSNGVLISDPNGCYANYSVVLDTIFDNCTPSNAITVTAKAKVVSNNQNIPLTITPLGIGGYTITATFGMPVGNNRVVVKATDAQGNIDSCVYFIQVNDTWAPIIANCPVNPTAVVNPSTCTAVVNYNIPTASDNCSGVGMVINNPAYQSGGTFPLGITPVTYTATDGSGNTTLCSFNVNVTGTCNTNADLAAAIFTPALSLFNTNESRDYVLKISNVTSNPTAGTVQFFVASSSGYNFTVNPTQTTTTTLFGTQPVTNADWDIIPLPSGILFSSKAGVVISPNSTKQIALNVMSLSAMNTGVITIVILPGSGGDINASNNSSSFGISTN
jgi:hypothetical protein